MKINDWEIIKKCARMEQLPKIPAALIVDSPWIPGYTGITTADFYAIPEKWFDAYIRVKKDFPGLILIPDFWVEYGMAAEPSGFGTKTVFHRHKMPNVNHLIDSADDIKRLCSLKTPNPKTDGFMSFILSRYQNTLSKVHKIGESIKIAAARGHLTTAAHLMGLTEFLIALKVYPDYVHKLLNITTALAVDWLYAQLEVIGEAEGIFLLDDIVGFLSKEDYLEFAHPYLKKIFGSFKEFVHFYHNDTDNPVCFEFLEDLGINIFNFTHQRDIAQVKKLCGGKVCLMGNIPPLDILANGTPDEVTEKSLACLKEFPEKRGLILSAGGGASTGTPRQNIIAMMEAAQSF